MKNRNPDRTLDRIADRAGANKRMPYYYFGDKDRLFPAALERLVTFTWTYYLEHPEFLTLLNSANPHKGRRLKNSQRVRDMHSTLVETLRKLLRKGAAQGLFRVRWPGARVTSTR